MSGAEYLGTSHQGWEHNKSLSPGVGISPLARLCPWRSGGKRKQGPPRLQAPSAAAGSGSSPTSQPALGVGAISWMSQLRRDGSMHLLGGTQYPVVSGCAPGLSVPMSTPLPGVATGDLARQLWVHSSQTGSPASTPGVGGRARGQCGCCRERRGDGWGGEGRSGGPRSLQKDSGFALSEVGAGRGPGEVPACCLTRECL